MLKIIKKGFTKRFSKLCQDDIQWFKNNVGKVIRDAQQVSKYNLDWIKKYKGNGQLVLLPGTVSEVSKILKYCNNKNLAVVPQGGNTGLVGGSIPVDDEIILSTKRLNKILSFDSLSQLLICQAGCILQDLNQYVGKQGCQVPLDLGAKGSCMIGGNIATNAGGKYLVKHGPFRSHILGLQLVSAEGQIIDLMSTVRKDNTGYDLKQLLIGSQGTLGIITKASINCVRIPSHRQIILCKTSSFQKLKQGMISIRKILGNSLGACQYMDGYTYKTVQKHVLKETQVLKNCNQTDHILLVQISTDHDPEYYLNKITENVCDKFQEMQASQNLSSYHLFWKIRQQAPVAVSVDCLCYKYDVSLPFACWQDFTNKVRSWNLGYTVSYGHAGDANIHLNICCNGPVAQIDKFQKQIFQYVIKLGGSISAQHGIGQQKAKYLNLQKSDLVLNILAKLKQQFDSKGILNPYKMIDIR